MDPCLFSKEKIGIFPIIHETYPITEGKGFAKTLGTRLVLDFSQTVKKKKLHKVI